MRRVIKGEEPATFINWKSRGNDDWNPTYSALQNPEKRLLHQALLCEQGFTCCYCGRPIDLTDSHIEHFRPQTVCKPQALDYENLMASCIRESSPGTPLHCGHLKGEWFDEFSTLSPLQHDIESFFHYSLIGGIVGLTDEATIMVSRLGLSVSFLNRRRKAALDGIFDAKFIERASKDDFLRVANDYRQISGDGSLKPFFHVVARLAEELAARL